MITFRKRSTHQPRPDRPMTVTAYPRKENNQIVHLQLGLSAELLAASGWRQGDSVEVDYDQGFWTLGRTLNRRSGYTLSLMSGKTHRCGLKITAAKEQLEELGLSVKQPRCCVLVERDENRIVVRYE